jgi:hypothetical protein
MEKARMAKATLNDGRTMKSQRKKIALNGQNKGWDKWTNITDWMDITLGLIADVSEIAKFASLSLSLLYVFGRVVRHHTWSWA